jgi:nicotinamide-nucleotide adenylyltransferase
MTESTEPQKLSRIGMVARWRPVHLGHAAILHALCRFGRHAFIGVGSSNTYDARNPFTLEETMHMLHLALEGHDNYTLIPVPDLHNGPRWRLMILDLFGPLDAFVTENPYVTSLMLADYHVIRPVSLLFENEKVAVDGSLVRQTMARGQDWQSLVPPKVAEYIVSNRLDERFRREFGLQTLALASMME